MQSSHAAGHLSASFSDPNVIASAGLVPVVRLAERCGLPGLVRRHVDLGGYYGSEPGGQGDEPGRGDVRGRGQHR